MHMREAETAANTEQRSPRISTLDHDDNRGQKNVVGLKEQIERRHQDTEYAPYVYLVAAA